MGWRGNGASHRHAVGQVQELRYSRDVSCRCPFGPAQSYPRLVYMASKPPPPPLHRCQGRNGQDVAHPAISPSPCCLPTSVSWLEGNVRCVHAPMAPCTSRGLSPYPLAASLGGSFRHALLNSRLTFPLPLPAPTISLLFPSVNSTPRSGPPPHSTPPRTKLV